MEIIDWINAKKYIPLYILNQKTSYMKFQALEVKRGDAFLIQEDERITLFDSGDNAEKIVDILMNKRINYVDLAICSHNDKDHAEGFIGIFESGIQIKELWLPGIWANILHYVIHVNNEFVYEGIRAYGHNINGEIIEDELYDSEQVLSIDELNADLRYLSLEPNDILQPCIICHHRLCQHYQPLNIYFIDLARIIQIAKLAYSRGTVVKWFKPTDYCTHNNIAYGFLALNSEQITHIKTIKNITAFLKVLSLTRTNKYSLVFELIKDNTPIIRFSADSDCTYQSQQSYNSNIIITAPHHGAKANAKVYRTIQGNDIIWIRSDGPSIHRPCQEFKSMNRRYCMYCNTHNTKSEITFEYDSQYKYWIYRDGQQCHC